MTGHRCRIFLAHARGGRYPRIDGRNPHALRDELRTNRFGALVLSTGGDLQHFMSGSPKLLQNLHAEAGIVRKHQPDGVVWRRCLCGGNFLPDPLMEPWLDRGRIRARSGDTSLPGKEAATGFNPVTLALERVGGKWNPLRGLAGMQNSPIDRLAGDPELSNGVEQNMASETCSCGCRMEGRTLDAFGLPGCWRPAT